MSNVWELIKNGEFGEACRTADEEFSKTSSLLPLRNKVLALLRLGRYVDAAQLCDEVIKRSNGDSDSDFAFLGVAYWLDGRRDDAEAAWLAASATKYTDAAGGVEIWLLLLYASIKRGNLSLQQKSKAKLLALCDDATIGNWPGPIARYVLRQLNEDELVAKISNQPVLSEKESCQAEFYIGLMRLGDGDRRGFAEFISKSASHPAVCILKQEFHLADAENRVEKLATNATI